MTVKSCEKQEKSQVLLTIEVGPEEFNAAIEKAYRKNRRKYRVNGFRPGKATRKMIEVVYGEEIETAAERMVSIALERGAPDNVTALLIAGDPPLQDHSEV